MDINNTDQSGVSTEAEAFDTIATDFGGEDFATFMQPYKDSSTEDTANTTGDSRNSEDATQTTEDIDDSPSSSDDVSDDLQKRIDDLVEINRKNEQHMTLLYGRLNNLSDLYQQERTRRDSPSNQEVKTDTVPEAVKELQELYPEIYAGMQAYIDSKTKELEKTVDKRIAPVHDSISTMNQQQHTQAIMEAHPDVGAILNSGKLDSWVNSLDSVAKTGANTILQYGDAKAVNGLLTQFKASSHYAASDRKPQQQTTQSRSQTSKSTSGLSEEDIQKIIAGISIQSGRGGDLSVTQQQAGPQDNWSQDDWFKYFTEQDAKKKF